MLFLNDCIRFYFGCVVVKRCKKENNEEDGGVYRYEHTQYGSLLSRIRHYSPRPLDWTDLDCTEFFGCTQKY